MKPVLQRRRSRITLQRVVLFLLIAALVSCPATSFHVGNRDGGRRLLSMRNNMVSEKEGSSKQSALFSVESATVNATSDALFSDETNVAASAKFGDVVRPKYLSSQTATTATTTTSPITEESNSSTLSIDEVEAAAQMRRRNLGVAIASIAVALLNYFWQFTHPISPVQLLVGMQETSAPLSVIGQNGKPTVVDFWAPVGRNQQYPWEAKCLYETLV